MRLVGHFPEREKDRLARVENGGQTDMHCAPPPLTESERYITASGEIWSKMPEKWTISAIELISQQQHNITTNQKHNVIMIYLFATPSKWFGHIPC